MSASSVARGAKRSRASASSWASSARTTADRPPDQLGYGGPGLFLPLEPMRVPRNPCGFQGTLRTNSRSMWSLREALMYPYTVKTLNDAVS